MMAVAGLLAGCSAAGPPASGSAGGSASGMSGASQAAGQNPNLDPGTSVGNAPAPDFRLMNQFGQPVSLSQFRGKVVLLSFEDAECTGVCPLTSESELLAKEYLGKAGENVQLLGVNANPMASKVSDVMAYTRAHGMVNQWDMLTGTDAQLKAVWKAYHIADIVSGGDVDHTHLRCM
jgi:cytochrome oxidase Cu insertion factor (SCO1/SenC/PrrC family)